MFRYCVLNKINISCVIICLLTILITLFLNASTQCTQQKHCLGSGGNRLHWATAMCILQGWGMCACGQGKSCDGGWGTVGQVIVGGSAHGRGKKHLTRTI